MKIHCSSAAAQIAYHALGPALQLLRMPHPASQPVDKLLASTLRQVENWGAGNENIGPIGPHPTRTLSPKEGIAVYGAFDGAFQQVFPNLASMAREDAAQHIRTLINDVRPGLKRENSPASADKKHLYDFLRAAENRLEDLEEWLAAA